jgi:hypothetical protein
MYVRSYLGEDEDGLGAFNFAQAGGAAASMAANYYLPGSGPIVSGITSLFSKLFGGGPSRHEKSDAAIEAAKKYMPKDLPDLIKKIEGYLSFPDACGTGLTFGGARTTGKEGRAQYTAACLTALKLGMKADFRACPPYDKQWCPHRKAIREFFKSILPDLKAGRLPGSTPEQASLIGGLMGAGTTNLIPLLLLGGGIYLIARR